MRTSHIREPWPDTRISQPVILAYGIFLLQCNFCGITELYRFLKIIQLKSRNNKFKVKKSCFKHNINLNNIFFSYTKSSYKQFVIFFF